MTTSLMIPRIVLQIYDIKSRIGDGHFFSGLTKVAKWPFIHTGETRHLALQRGDIYVHSSVNFIFHHFLDIQSKNCGDYLRLNGLKLNLNILNKSSLQIGKMGPFSI